MIDILAEELGWDRKRKEQELHEATVFLGSFGLPPNAAPRASMSHQESHSVLEPVKNLIGLKSSAEQRRPAAQMVYSQAAFETGEIEQLRRAFSERAQAVEAPAQSGGVQLSTVKQTELFGLVKSLPGFEGIKVKDYDYVLEEAGFARSGNVDFDEFMEVR